MPLARIHDLSSRACPFGIMVGEIVEGEDTVQDLLAADARAIVPSITAACSSTMRSIEKHWTALCLAAMRICVRRA
jgi:hypothetical protein